MADAAEWWVTIRMCAAVLERDHIQTSTGLDEELAGQMVDLAENATMLADYFEACVDALRTSNIRPMAGVSRHLVARGAA